MEPQDFVPVDRLATWVRFHRTAAMLTQEELAALTNVSVRTVRNLEAGRAVRAATARLVVAELTGIPRPGVPAEPVPVPAQLVSDVPGFTGREAELRALDAHLAAGTPANAIAVLSGPAGVGKTGLAVHWAHQARAAFPDGQLYADLRSSVPGASPGAADVLAAFLRALGVSPRAVPRGVDERAARFRTLLAGRRTLVMLDDAGATDQIWPLLPGAAGCPVLVTSRGRLAGLVARAGARRIGLGPLPLRHALGLLRSLLGDQGDARRTGGAGLVELAERCGRLPLTLRLAAEAALAAPGLSPSGTSRVPPSRSTGGPTRRS